MILIKNTKLYEDHRWLEPCPSVLLLGNLTVLTSAYESVNIVQSQELLQGKMFVGKGICWKAPLQQFKSFLRASCWDLVSCHGKHLFWKWWKNKHLSRESSCARNQVPAAGLSGMICIVEEELFNKRLFQQISLHELETELNRRNVKFSPTDTYQEEILNVWFL